MNFRKLVKIIVNEERTLPLKLLQSNYISFVVTVEQNGNTPDKTVIILDIVSNEQKRPKFQHEVYTGVLLLDKNSLDVDEILLDEETYTDDIRIQFWDSADIFYCYQRGREIFIQVSDFKYQVEDLTLTKFVVFTITAIKSNGSTGTTFGVIIIARSETANTPDKVIHWYPDNETYYEISLDDDDSDEDEDYESDDEDDYVEVLIADI
jgi:hypothetical protein